MSARPLQENDWGALAQNADFQPANLAVLCGISLRQLQRLFQQRFQKSPRVWLRERQYQLARELIFRGHSNKAVIAELKFSSESNFCRAFKKFFGDSPQSFKPGAANLTKMSLVE